MSIVELSSPATLQLYSCHGTRYRAPCAEGSTCSVGLEVWSMFPAAQSPFATSSHQQKLATSKLVGLSAPTQTQQMPAMPGYFSMVTGVPPASLGCGCGYIGFGSCRAAAGSPGKSTGANISQASVQLCHAGVRLLHAQASPTPLMTRGTARAAQGFPAALAKHAGCHWRPRITESVLADLSTHLWLCEAPM